MDHCRICNANPNNTFAALGKCLKNNVEPTFKPYDNPEQVSAILRTMVLLAALREMYYGMHDTATGTQRSTHSRYEKSCRSAVTVFKSSSCMCSITCMFTHYPASLVTSMYSTASDKVDQLYALVIFIPN